MLIEKLINSYKELFDVEKELKTFFRNHLKEKDTLVFYSSQNIYDDNDYSEFNVEYYGVLVETDENLRRFSKFGDEYWFDEIDLNEIDSKQIDYLFNSSIGFLILKQLMQDYNTMVVTYNKSSDLMEIKYGYQ